MFTRKLEMGIKSGLLITAVVVLPLSAMAEEIRVSTGDLNLRTDAGVKSLHRRIDGATSAVCGGVEFQMQLRMQRQYSACRTAARADAYSQVEAMIAANQVARDIVVAAK
jgi:UrcA family protein